MSARLPRRRACDTTPLWGAALIVSVVSWGTAALCVIGCVVYAVASRHRSQCPRARAPLCLARRRRFAVLGAKLLPPTGNPILDFLRRDWYYPLLAVMCVPTTLVAVYLNWLGMKFFRHTGGRGA